MNHVTYNKAVEGYLLYAHARNLSARTIADYRNGFHQFANHIGGDTIFADISSLDIISFLAAHADRVSNKTLYNYHIALSSLWSWAIKFGLVEKHIVRLVDRPRPQRPEIKPLTEKDVRALLGSLDRSKPYRGQTHRVHQPERQKAIIYLLLDTGVRASELCSLNVKDVDFSNRKISVWGKGNKERYLTISARTAQVIWKYLQLYRDDPPDNSPLFVTRNAARLHRRQLLRRLQTIGQRAGIPDLTVHRFRHTFAITYLRNGGNIYALQSCLGHSTLTMIRRYLSIVEADLTRSHEIASPITNWGL